MLGRYTRTAELEARAAEAEHQASLTQPLLLFTSMLYSPSRGALIALLLFVVVLVRTTFTFHLYLSPHRNLAPLLAAA